MPKLGTRKFGPAFAATIAAATIAAAAVVALGTVGSAGAATAPGTAPHPAHSVVNGPTNGSYYKFWQVQDGVKECVTWGLSYTLLSPCAQGSNPQKWFDQSATNGHKLVYEAQDDCLNGDAGTVTTPCTQGSVPQVWKFTSVTGTTQGTTKVYITFNNLRYCLDSSTDGPPIALECQQGDQSQKWDYAEVLP